MKNVKDYKSISTAPNNENLYLICINSKAVGYPLSEDAANVKIDHLTNVPSGSK
jgi:hypothetical protein